MPRSIVSKGQTVEKAIQTGLQLLQSTIEDVNIDVIRINGKGLFRLKNKLAVVKLTLIDEKDPNSIRKSDNFLELVEEALMQSENKALNPVEQQEDKFSGKAWIENGKIFVNQSPTHFPMLVPCKNVSIFKNDVRLSEATILRADDDIRLETNSERIEPYWKINVNATSMEARLHVRPGYETHYIVEDCEPSSLLKIRAEQLEKKMLTVKIQDVITRLNEMGISFGLDYDEIRRGAESDEEGSFVIAQGVFPKEGKNGQLNYLIDMEYKTKHPTERPDGTIDFRESFHVPSVSPGQVISEYLPPVSGEPGKNVYGVLIPAPPVFDLIFHTKSGIMLLEPENKLIAKDHGRPHIEKRGLLVKASILPKLTVTEDVNIEKGNIHFIGDVELLKNVDEKMVVEADGDIILHGNVNFSELTAGSSIVIKKNAISSKITAGKGNMLISDLYQLLGDMESQLFKLVQAIKQLYTANAFKTSDLAMMGLGSLIKLLVEQKFRTLIPIVKDFVEKIDEGKNLLDEEWHDLAHRLRKGFLILSKDEFTSVEELMQLLSDVGRFYQISSLPPEPDSSISIGYTLNSSIYCSGDVRIFQEGCYNSKVHSGGKIKIDGYLRGGNLYGKLGAVVHEAGSEGGSRAVIHVPHNQSIRIEKVNEGTMIKVGNQSHLFTECAENVYARLDHNEKLLLF